MRTLWCRECFWSASRDGLKHRTGWIRVGYSKTSILSASVRECLIPLLVFAVQWLSMTVLVELRGLA